ncbi:hypothetical protein E2C01_077207 [Portunus trituberculatus]|uniref:Uncharacterized protein n=1 Tax=Portunus trituberculatus TaxID=210409 RepID=A0A5B7IJN0_PORTR|nr:hypothetical protein [Portunus trituberculatus]
MFVRPIFHTCSVDECQYIYTSETFLCSEMNSNDAKGLWEESTCIAPPCTSLSKSCSSTLQLWMSGIKNTSIY